MWFIARAELRHGRSRFALLAGLVALLAFLVFVMTGLSTGLGDATVSGVRRLTDGATLVAYTPDAQRSLARSDLPVAQVAVLASAPGVTGAWPVGQSMASVEGAAHRLAVAVVGVPAEAPMAPSELASQPDGLVLDRNGASEAGVEIGDTVTLTPGEVHLTVTGLADLGSIQHAPVAATDLATWQRLRYAPFADDPASVPDRAGAVLVTVAGDPTAARSAATAAGLDVASGEEAVSAVPGFAAETGTIGMLRGFLFAISALLVAVVFWVLTLQKEGALAVLRTGGASRGLLLGSYLVQVLAVSAAGVVVGLVAAGGAAALLPPGTFVLTASAAASAAGLLVALALVGSASSLRRLLTVDPLLSLGRA